MTLYSGGEKSRSANPWLLDLLSLIRGRPGMYLGSEEVRTLSTFLLGYRAARVDLGAPETTEEEEALFTAFTPWLKEKFADNRNVSWETIIEDQFLRAPTTTEARRQRSPTDGSAKLFFALFEEYLATRQLAYTKIDPRSTAPGELFHPRREGPSTQIPELVTRDDGARERTWTVQFRSQVSPPSESFARAVAERAQQLYRQNLAEKALEHLAGDISLQVALRRTLPRTLEARIARGGTAPNWDVAADTWVMIALEEQCGRITKWQNIPREEWKLWPIPPGERVSRANP